MKNTLKTLWENTYKIIYPDFCPYCTKLLEHFDYACESCKKKIPENGITQGVRGGYRSCSALHYSGIFKRALFRFKFRKKKYHARQFAYLLHRQVQNSYPDMIFDYITYVPMHKKALRKRGFNQCEALAKELSKLMGIPYRSTLVKIRNTKPQHELESIERYTNLIGAFKVADKNAVKDKSILLLDDVITTGSTLGECAKTLQKAKPAHICCVTLLSVANLFY